MVLVRVTFAATLSRVMPTGDADMKFLGTGECSICHSRLSRNIECFAHGKISG